MFEFHWKCPDCKAQGMIEEEEDAEPLDWVARIVAAHVRVSPHCLNQFTSLRRSKPLSNVLLPFHVEQFLEEVISR